MSSEAFPPPSDPWPPSPGAAAPARKARPVVVDRDAPLETLLAASFASGLAQLVENEPAATCGSDPEGVHQMRIGARRLRVALALFGPILADDVRRPLRAELRWLARTLGPVRDLDVLVVELLGPLCAERPADAGLARLHAAAEGARAEARARLRESFADPRRVQLARTLGDWIARCGWRDAPAEEASQRLLRPARVHVAAVLERWHAAVVVRGARLDRATPEERHRLRIRLKRLRYGAELGRSLFGPRKTERYLRRLGRLQEGLGRLNDAAAAERHLAALCAGLGDPGDEDARAAGFAAGWVAHAAHADLRRLPKRWARFAGTRRFWRGARAVP